MTTFTVNDLDPLFVFNKVKMIKFLDDICAVLSLANGPVLYDELDGNTYATEKNDYSFLYSKTSEFDNLEVVFKHKGMFLLKVKNSTSTSLEITLNIKDPTLETKEIIHLLEPYKKKKKSPSRPSDG